MSGISSGHNISIAFDFSNIYKDIYIHVAFLWTTISFFSIDTVHPFPKFLYLGIRPPILGDIITKYAHTQTMSYILNQTVSCVFYTCHW